MATGVAMTTYMLALARRVDTPVVIVDTAVRVSVTSCDAGIRELLSRFFLERTYSRTHTIPGAGTLLVRKP